MRYLRCAPFGSHYQAVGAAQCQYVVVQNTCTSVLEYFGRWTAAGHWTSRLMYLDCYS